MTTLAAPTAAASAATLLASATVAAEIGGTMLDAHSCRCSRPAISINKPWPTQNSRDHETMLEFDHNIRVSLKGFFLQVRSCSLDAGDFLGKNLRASNMAKVIQ